MKLIDKFVYLTVSFSHRQSHIFKVFLFVYGKINDTNGKLQIPEVFWFCATINLYRYLDYVSMHIKGEFFYPEQNSLINVADN